MGYKQLAQLCIAVIGTGKVGEALAQGLALAGHDILRAAKDEQTLELEHMLSGNPDCIELCSLESAGFLADVIIMATPMADVREMAYLLDDVKSKVIIDASEADMPVHDAQYFNSVNAIRAITGSLHVVKCFNNAAPQQTRSSKRRSGSPDMFVAGDSLKGKAVARMLASELGFTNCHDFGGNDTIPMLDELATGWSNLSILQHADAGVSFRLVTR
jgi:predicted dinucleotide-binding enzyme